MCKVTYDDVTGWKWDGRLWHAQIDGQYESLCGKRIPANVRALKFFHPADDTACAKCCRKIWGPGMGMSEGA